MDKLHYKVYESVYEPAEDSFLLIKHTRNLKGKILEIGCGSGVVCLTNALRNPKNSVFACDRSKDALKLTKENAKLNKLTNVKIFQSNLFSNVPKTEKFDYILFNPPYLPTSKEERLKGDINYAYDGGEDGRKVLEKFLAQFGKFLKSTGAVFLIHSSLNSPQKAITILSEKGFKSEVLEEQSYFFEKLVVLKIKKA